MANFIVARTAAMSGAQSSPSVSVFPLTKKDRLPILFSRSLKRFFSVPSTVDTRTESAQRSLDLYRTDTFHFRWLQLDTDNRSLLPFPFASVRACALPRVSNHRRGYGCVLQAKLRRTFLNKHPLPAEMLFSLVVVPRRCCSSRSLGPASLAVAARASDFACLKSSQQT